MQSLDIPRRYRQLQRATVARSALDVIALVFLGCGFAFWSVAFWQLLTPPAILSLLSIQAVVLALAFSLAAPLLLSMLVPTTPAGQMLQRTQYATVGFYVILGSALFLVYQAEQLIETWLFGQPGVRELVNWRSLAIVLVVAFVVIPALAWIQVTPERWLAAIQQAHAVKKLELQQRGELAIVKASLVRAERLALKGWANLLPLEQEEVFQTMRALIQSTSDTQRDIVRTLDLSSDLERSIMDDETIATELAHVARALDVLPDLNERAPAAIDPPHVDSRSQSSELTIAPSDSAMPGRTQSDQVYDAIARSLPPVFTAADISTHMRWTDKREGQRVIRAWLDQGAAKEVRLGRYSLVRGDRD